MGFGGVEIRTPVYVSDEIRYANNCTTTLFGVFVGPLSLTSKEESALREPLNLSGLHGSTFTTHGGREPANENL